MQRKQILVTGGAGYIGSHTIVTLLEEGYEPIVLDDFRNANPAVIKKLQKLTKKEIPFFNFSCCDFDKLIQLFKKYSFSGVIHFAADKAVGESVVNPLKYFDNNITGLISLLKVIEKYPNTNLVFSSSCTVYGNPTSYPVTESFPVGFNSPYGFTKLCNEQMLMQFHTALQSTKICSLRYFNPIGAHESGLIGEEPIGAPNNLVPFITQTAAGWREQLTVFGNDYNTPDGSCLRDYIHVMDLAEAHVSALKYLEKRKEGCNAIFNIGTGIPTSVLELIKVFEQETGKTLNWKFGPRRAGDVPAIYANVEKSLKELHWKAKRSVNEAVLSAWNFQKHSLITNPSIK
ncbi:MAG: UDP-glucose 4-epimerase GalE [Crocinitomicaceae bacterium]|nr:UDP-glucose 4-epimerase GalE [Crocinitomicaceae bacterium]